MFTQRTRTHTHTHMHTHTHTHTHAHTRTRTYACRHRPFTYSPAFICRRIRSASRQRSDPLFLFLRQMLVYVLPLLFWIHSFISSSSSHHIHNAICTYAVIHSYCRCLYVRIHRVLEPFYALHLTPMRCLLISGPVGPLIGCTGVICRSARTFLRIPFHLFIIFSSYTQCNMYICRYTFSLQMFVCTYPLHCSDPFDSDALPGVDQLC